MAVYEYEAVAYRQSQDPSAPWLVSFVATAEELLDWAGIPRRSDTGVVGFQRAFDEDRVLRAKDFFNLGINQSPTALVVGIHPSAEGVQQATLDFIDPETEKIRKCRLKIEYDGEMSASHAAEIVRAKLVQRLADAVEEAEGVGSDAEESDSDDTSELNDGDSAGNGGNDEIEMGKSVVSVLREKLDDLEWCAKNLDALIDLAKPATIIDGQHRVKGAEACERNIPFAVCAIFDCTWPEQVFQFTVVNYTAKGIPDQFITANAALSLTEDELKTLEARLVQARVKVVEYEIMKVVQFDSNSPFYDMVNLTEKKDSSKIGYKTMVRLARVWYSPTRPMFQLLLQNLYPGKHRKERLRAWKAGDWGTFFTAFWSLIRKHYEGHASHEDGCSLWDVGHSNLVIAVVLLQLQDTIFANFEQQDEEFWEVPQGSDPLVYLLGKMSKRVQRNLDYFPSEFFASVWKTKSLNTGAGRQALTDAFENLAKKKGSYQYARSSLITGKTGG